MDKNRKKYELKQRCWYEVKIGQRSPPFLIQVDTCKGNQVTFDVLQNDQRTSSRKAREDLEVLSKITQTEASRKIFSVRGF